MSADDLDLEPLGPGELPTLDDLEALDRRDELPPAHPADAQFVADMADATEHLNLRDPRQARQWLAAYRRAERRRKASVRRRRGGIA